MKKLSILIIMILLLGACTNNITEDPYIKESLRKEVLIKAQTDTTVTVVQVKDEYYFIENGEIKGITNKKVPDVGYVVFITIIAIALFAIAIALSIRN
jgi:ABC-type Fe3+-hydroxamate transport system substrate-binding protein